MERVSVEITLGQVDPELLNILTGSPITTNLNEVEIRTPIKRTFWEWLCRKPQRWELVKLYGVTFDDVCVASETS